MKTKFFLLPVAVFLIAMTACKKEKPATTEPTAVTSIFDLRVSDNFNFKSTRDIRMKFHTTNGNFAGEVVRINIYDDFPTIAHVITSGLTKVGEDYEMSFRILSALTDIYIEKVLSNGARELQRVKAADYIAANFNQSPVIQLKTKPGSGLNCSTGCTQTYNNYSGGTLNLNGGTYCMTGSFNGSINVGAGATVRFCGNASISGITLNSSSSKIYFLENSIVTVGNINFNNAGARVENYSDSLKFTASISVAGTLVNNGKMSVNGDLSINNNGNNYMTNNGEIYVKTNLNNNKTLTNNNKIFVNGMFQPNGGSVTYNNCQLISVGNYNNNGSVYNYGYLKCDATASINGGSTHYIYSGALFSTKNITINGSINGASNSGLGTVKVTQNTTFNGGGQMSGNMEFCDTNGIETNNGTFNSPAAATCNNYIATTACNPEGFGTATITDTDGDGVADAQDDYPNDSTRAYNSYYPSASTFATFGFEDLWPSQGDYDFNDLVLSYRTKQVLNASNNVVEFYTTYLVRAIGATYDNGFGVQLDDLVPTDISNISGQQLSKSLISLNSNKTESGQTKAVVIVYDSPEPLIHRNGGSFFNTIKGNSTGTFDTLNLHVSFTNPIASSKLTQAKFNPFIFVNGTRGTEIHHPNMTPTSLANSQLFGTKNDNSDPSIGRYYKTANNLPFVIEVPVSFAYPAEKESISDAYNYFISWASSDGVNYTNWYSDLSGYRNASKIY
ncbi:MAG: LruC domain-containing protein [Bacteroidetes bacterium]|nr:LruC domain-containing protein [Bacteroidota bacterium]